MGARVTLLGTRLARVGESFVFSAPCAAAAACPIAKTCQNLEPGRAYRVVAKRPIHHDTCTEHEGGVDAVEVEALPILASVESSKLRGTLIRWTPLVCDRRTCPNWSVCFNPALQPSGEYRIVASQGAMTCPVGYRLEKVEVAASRPKPVG